MGQSTAILVVTSAVETQAWSPLAGSQPPSTSLKNCAVGVLPSSRSGFQDGARRVSLNSDPRNIHAEELAMEDCTLGVDIRRTWSETELVRSFGGREFPGTPDGMFESWDGVLTCVQVVRVPLQFGFSLEETRGALSQTILSKVVKSQQWLRASNFVPHDFIIFCWLPFSIPDEIAKHAETLMQDVQAFDSRFSLRLRVPALENDLFPALFACNYDVEKHKARGYSWSDMATFSGSDPDADDDEPLPWDITWAWESDLAAAVVEQPTSTKSAESQDKQVVCGTSASTESLYALQSGGKWNRQDAMEGVSVLLECAKVSRYQLRSNRFWDPGG